jgi:predicted deacetylase
MKALISIHDVMPHTLERVERILDWLKARSVSPVTLLVVPGRPWKPDHIGRLRELAAEGHELAAHGWHHETRPRHLYHRLHAALISRNVAEHLDLNSQGILQLMQRSRAWFGANDLPLPDFYVPPAWALGPLSTTDLAQVPYRLVETTRGLIHLEGNALSLLRLEEQAATTKKRPTFQKLSLTGYEADTAFREFFLRRWNAAQARAAARKKLPLRISIHPDDLELRVADQLEQQITDVKTFLPYRDYVDDLNAVIDSAKNPALN